MGNKGYETKEAKLKQIQDNTVKLKQFIGMRAQAFETEVSKQYDRGIAGIASTSSETGKLTTSLRHKTMHANKMIDILDSVSAEQYLSQLMKSIDICVKSEKISR